MHRTKCTKSTYSETRTVYNEPAPRFSRGRLPKKRYISTLRRNLFSQLPPCRPTRISTSNYKSYLYITYKIIKQKCRPTDMSKTSQLLQTGEFTRTLFSLYLIIRRWEVHAARFRHGPHPCSLWRLGLLQEFKAFLERTLNFPFGNLQLWCKQKVWCESGRKVGHI